MKPGAENRRKTVLAGALGAVALCCLIYGYNAIFGDPGPAKLPPTPVATTQPSPARSTGSSSSAAASNNARGTASGTTGQGIAPGVAAKRMASASASLDPTLDESSMLRTESLVYSGAGRNIFSSTYTPAALALPRNVPSARPAKPVYVPPPPPPGPPPPPPMNLKFFGTLTYATGQRKVYLLSGDDVYLAAQGDIVARKYKIVSIATTSIQVEDLANNNTQTLPLQR